jgi:hypothetical protein
VAITSAIATLCVGSVAHADNTGAAAPNSPTGGAGQISLPLPGSNFPGGQNLTAEQMKTIMAYRYLQSRGGGGQVRRGMPQFIPFGYGNGPQDMQAQQAGGAGPAASPTSDRDAKKQEAKQKRVEALKAAAEKKKAARDARAQQRKAQQGQPVATGPK